MPANQPSPRGWPLQVIAGYLLIAAAVVVWMSMGDIKSFPENESRPPLSFTLMVFGPVLGIPVTALLTTPILLLCLWRKRERRFLPLCAALALGGSATAFVLPPPSPQTFFRFVFDAPLPPSATAIRVNSGGFGRSPIIYFFTCSEAESRTLVRALGMTEMPSLTEEPVVSEKWPDLEAWAGRRLFSRVHPSDKGTGWLLCDSTGTQVYVWWMPVFEKTASP